MLFMFHYVPACPLTKHRIQTLPLSFHPNLSAVKIKKGCHNFAAYSLTNISVFKGGVSNVFKEEKEDDVDMKKKKKKRREGKRLKK